MSIVFSYNLTLLISYLKMLAYRYVTMRFSQTSFLRLVKCNLEIYPSSLGNDKQQEANTRLSFALMRFAFVMSRWCRTPRSDKNQIYDLTIIYGLAYFL